MFQVIDDTIYYHGHKLAVVVAPLSGWRMDAIDALNLVDHFPVEDVRDVIREVRADVNQVVDDSLTAAIEAVWINDTQHNWIKDTVDAGLSSKLAQTWASWNVDG